MLKEKDKISDVNEILAQYRRHRLVAQTRIVIFGFFVGVCVASGIFIWGDNITKLHHIVMGSIGIGLMTGLMTMSFIKIGYQYKIPEKAIDDLSRLDLKNRDGFIHLRRQSIDTGYITMRQVDQFAKLENEKRNNLN